MSEATPRYKYRYSLLLVVFFVILLTSCLSPDSDRTKILTEDPNTTAEAKAQAEAAALRSATKSATTVFAPSLEMKENVDFLLTPALLVQEAMSNDLITTYPSE
jgi:hypothetical protein